MSGRPPKTSNSFPVPHQSPEPTSPTTRTKQRQPIMTLMDKLPRISGKNASRPITRRPRPDTTRLTQHIDNRALCNVYANPATEDTVPPRCEKNFSTAGVITGDKKSTVVLPKFEFKTMLHLDLVCTTTIFPLTWDCKIPPVNDSPQTSDRTHEDTMYLKNRVRSQELYINRFLDVIIQQLSRPTTNVQSRWMCSIMYSMKLFLFDEKRYDGRPRL